MADRGLVMGCLAWAGVGALLAVSGLATVDDDARILVVAATMLGVGAALLAALLLVRGKPRWAGLCLTVSVITPTWAAAAINLVPLVAGLVLVTIPAVGSTTPHRSDTDTA